MSMCLAGRAGSMPEAAAQHEHTLVSVLDLDNAAVGRHDPKTAGHASPTRDAPTTLIISLNDVKWIPQDPGVRQDETEPQGAV